jgi:hypothetical protein
MHDDYESMGGVLVRGSGRTALVVTSPTRLCAIKLCRLVDGRVVCSRTALERTTYVYFWLREVSTLSLNKFHVTAVSRTDPVPFAILTANRGRSSRSHRTRRRPPRICNCMARDLQIH